MTTKFGFYGEAARIACAELGFDPEAHFVGVHVAAGEIVIQGSVGKPEEHEALRSAVRARNWHYRRVDMRAEPREPADEATDRHCEEIARGRQLTDAEWRGHKAEQAAAAEREAVRRAGVDDRIRALASR